ncbi:preprotein translocase, SecG subunit [Treponema socranskii subsp. paredis ATCC 35535]|nr:preprotein translocase, SecG subunit [Treponema socranskii subsp. paredis ATCC 35535]
MGAIRIILLVAFIIACALLILIILVQDDGSSGMGGLLGGRGTTAFGSHSANILTKTTFVLVVLFFVFALALALLNKRPRLEQNLAPSETVQPGAAPAETQSNDWWKSSDSQSTADNAGSAAVEPQQ